MPFLSVFFALTVAAPQKPASTPQTPAQKAVAFAKKPQAAKTEAAAPLRFKEILEPTAKELRPTAKLLALVGKRVRITGFMIDQEEPTQGTFYLWKRPVFNDESGAGVGDVPPDAILVVVRGAKNAVINHSPRPLEVAGVLEVGPHTEENGASSMLRILLDRPQDIPASELRSAAVKNAHSASKKKRSIH